MPNVYTRGGDKGETSLFGASRTPKDNIRVDAYGTMDEANAAIGLAYSLAKDEKIKEILKKLQKRIFVLGAELASDAKGREMLKDCICQADIDEMEGILDHYLDLVGVQKEFVIPGESPESAALHMARTVVRRGERMIVTYNRQEDGVRAELIKFVNRLSDVLFILARASDYYNKIDEIAERVKVKMDGLTGQAEYLDVSQGAEQSLLRLAKKMAAAARVKAEEIAVPIVFSMVDKGGNLLYFERMEDALIGSIDISINKGYTANALKLSTDKVADLVKEDGSLYGLQWTNNNRMVVFGGGYPIIIKDEVVGGIGISGGSVDEDMIIAKSALKVL